MPQRRPPPNRLSLLQAKLTRLALIPRNQLHSFVRRVRRAPRRAPIQNTRIQTRPGRKQTRPGPIPARLVLLRRSKLNQIRPRPQRDVLPEPEHLRGAYCVRSGQRSLRVQASRSGLPQASR